MSRLVSQSLPAGLPVPGFASRDAAPPLGLALQATQTGSFSAASNTLVPVDKTNGSITATLPASPSIGDTIQFIVFGAANSFTLGLNGNKFYGSTVNPVTSGEGIEEIQWTGATRGWVDL